MWGVRGRPYCAGLLFRNLDLATIIGKPHHLLCIMASYFGSLKLPATQDVDIASRFAKSENEAQG